MAPIHTNDQRIQELANCCIERDPIDKALYTKNNVNIGLRDLNGRGVLSSIMPN